MSHKCTNHSRPQKEFSAEQIVAVLEQAEAGVPLAGLLQGSGFPSRCSKAMSQDVLDYRTSFVLSKRDVQRSPDKNKIAILWHQLQFCDRLLDGHEINAWWVKSHHHSVHTH